MKQFYRYHLMIIVLLATACAPGLNPSGSSSKSEFAGKPDWLSRKPFSQGYYRGIGYSPKTSGNYIQIAKKSALEDLVSEIKVNVSSSSILSQIDRNYEFQEEYQSLIKTTAADEIQEYELVDAWEDENSYWVYYQLSKARYNEIKAEEKRNATNLAFDFFKKAKEAERSYDAIQAMGFYFKALKGMEKYLGEAVRVDYKGNSIFLGNEIYASLQKILDKMVIRSDRNEYTINRRLNKGKSIDVKAVDRESGIPIINLPLTAYFKVGGGVITPEYTTDQNGNATILVSRIDSKQAQQKVEVTVNAEVLSGAEDDSDNFYAMLLNRFILPSASIILKVERPSVYIVSDELSLGRRTNVSQVENRIKSRLASAGFTFIEERGDADLVMEINSNTEEGPVSGSIYITYLTMTIRVIDGRSNREVYNTGLDRVKGYSLDYQRSSQEAYDKSLEILDEDKIPDLIDAVLQ